MGGLDNRGQAGAEAEQKRRGDAGPEEETGPGRDEENKRDESVEMD